MRASRAFEALLSGSAHAHEAKLATAGDARAREDRKVTSAIRTEFILSAAIWFITLAVVAEHGFWAQAAVRVLVGGGSTARAHGAVAWLVKRDRLGLGLAKPGRSPLTRRVGRGRVRVMPAVSKTRAIAGTAAMD
jgi:hypothetical protein